MKKRRTLNQSSNSHACDLILTDATGRSIRVNKALLIESSDYFAEILGKRENLKEIQLNERYLIELIKYLYDQGNDLEELEDPIFNSRSPGFTSSNLEGKISQESDLNGHLVILIHLLRVSRKYGFRKLSDDLYKTIMNQNQPNSAVTLFKEAFEMGLTDLIIPSRAMILQFLPYLQKSESFLNLSEGAINNLFSFDETDTHPELKLNALSAWWSQNKQIDMTKLWAQLVMKSRESDA